MVNSEFPVIAHVSYRCDYCVIIGTDKIDLPIYKGMIKWGLAFVYMYLLRDILHLQFILRHTYA